MLKNSNGFCSHAYGRSVFPKMRSLWWIWSKTSKLSAKQSKTTPYPSSKRWKFWWVCKKSTLERWHIYTRTPSPFWTTSLHPSLPMIKSKEKAETLKLQRPISKEEGKMKSKATTPPPWNLIWKTQNGGTQASITHIYSSNLPDFWWRNRRKALKLPLLKWEQRLMVNLLLSMLIGAWLRLVPWNQRIFDFRRKEKMTSLRSEICSKELKMS